MTQIFALLPAGGLGQRAQTGIPKQYALLAGKPMVQHTLLALSHVTKIDHMVLVVAPDDVAHGAALKGMQWSRIMPFHVVPRGGSTRAASVLGGLMALTEIGAQDDDWVLVHDVARCLIHPDDVQQLITTCLTDPLCRGGLLAIPLADTLKQSHAQEIPQSHLTLERQNKWLAQTPQLFQLKPLREALKHAQASDFVGITDEASAMELQGIQPLLVMGRSTNLKITYPSDRVLAEALLTPPPPTPALRLRIGEGWDIHALVENRPLKLGGVLIPFHYGLLGHSDADALLHAITDALLGAAGLGDIGQHFSDTDTQWANADSMILLRLAMNQVVKQGWKVINVDATIIAQAPKLMPYLSLMQANIARCLSIEIENVNVKAKTAEKMGAVGEGRAIEARAVVLIG